MKLYRLTQPLWLGNVAPLVKKYSGKGIDLPYESLWEYFCNVVQYGRLTECFSAVCDDDLKAVAFAHFGIEPPPYHGTITLKHIYSDDKEATLLLCDDMIQFGLENRCTQIMSYSPNRKVQNHFAAILKTKKYNLEPVKRFHWIAKKEV